MAKKMNPFYYFVKASVFLFVFKFLKCSYILQETR